MEIRSLPPAEAETPRSTWFLDAGFLVLKGTPRKYMATVCVGMLFLLSACRAGNPEEVSEPQFTTLRVALQSDPRTLDPHLATEAASMRVIEPFYNSLMRYSEEYGQVEPDLVESYEISPDGKVYSFHLKRGVRFHHSGREMTAGDVLFSLDRIRRKKIRAYQFSALDRVEILGPYHFRLHLKEPFAPLLTYLAHPMNAIVDSRAVDREGLDLKNHEAGTGAFQLAEWKKNQYLSVKKFPGYFHKYYPGLPGIRFITIPDATARSLALRSGEVDILLEVAPKDVSLLKRDPQIRLSRSPGTFWEYLGFNTRQKPFSDPRVRRAVAWAVDRSDLNLLVKQGRARVLPGGPIPQNHWVGGGEPIYTHRDLKRARSLLEEAGYTEGFETELLVGSDFKDQVDAAQVVKQQLKGAGIRVRIRALESSLFFSRLAAREFSMTLVGWVGFVDPDEWLYNLFHSGGIWNQQQYANPQVDADLEAGRHVLDPTLRKNIYRRVQKRIAQDAPMVFLYINPQIGAYRVGLENFAVHPTASAKILEKVRPSRESKP